MNENNDSIFLTQIIKINFFHVIQKINFKSALKPEFSIIN
jgi:hypothetical protein